MAETKQDMLNKVAVATWLCTLSVVGLVKIVVGSIYLEGGCLGLCLLPYYLLIGGVLALVPAGIALLTSCFKQSKAMEDMWSLMAKIFLFSFIFIIAGTIYLLSNVVRVSSLDRLCVHSWVPIFGLSVLVADWLLFALFYRLFCVNDLPESSSQSPLSPFEEDSPFHTWRQRNSRRNF